MIDLALCREALAAEGLDGWLLYDFKGLNPIAAQAVLPPGGHHTRRWFCYLPRDGEPRWLVHAIERAGFASVPGSVSIYAGRASLGSALGALVGGASRVAMEYSPGGNIPYVARVDGGTLELVRSLGLEVATSADLVQRLLASWPEGGRAEHDRAARALEAAVDDAFAAIGHAVAAGAPLTECAVQRQLVAAFEAAGLETDHPPIVATGPHAADPHFAPSEADDAPIGPDQVVMIDVWARDPGDAGVYADMTFMAYTGSEPPADVVAVWEAVRDGRDAALELVASRHAAGEAVRGFEVDRAARDVIEARGFGEAFVHRTGHSLGPQGHWIGANMDDYETKDTRRLIAGTGFTVEPGIYLPGRFGVRSEVDLYWDAGEGPVVTTRIQRELTLLG